MALTSVTIEQYSDLVGKPLEPSPWITVDQRMISAFASITMDRNFIHTDAARTKNETPFDGTIAHGFLTVSLLSHMAQQVMPDVENFAVVANYGMNRLRLLNPVLTGARLRGVFKLGNFNERKPGQWLATYDVKVEIEGEKKPALRAQWLMLFIQDR
ncbi:MAG: MaoC family dehydratase [Rhodobacteraceae bacterium]|nr:MaoC family dehydratase [Paracoccaceae bacterium]